MVSDRRDEIAARNNAEWCAAVWRAHGLPVEQRHGLWFCARETPPFYPNVVTVDPDYDPETQTKFIGELAGRSRFDFSVKDSFARLPLADAGLTPLFSATWLWLEPDAAPPLREGLGWRLVEVERLERWERAWRGDETTVARTFPEQLLDDADVRVIGGFDAQDEIVAGAIAYRAAGVVGLTNLFGSRSQATAAAAALLPGSPIVAYQAGEEPAQARRGGFEPIGRLTVWTGGGGS